MSNRGSEWARWDLHVHTKGTAKAGKFTSKTFEEFCNVLFTKAIEKEIKVIGITDYNSIEKYEETLEFQKNIANSNFFDEQQKQVISTITLLPNIELRILPTTKKGSLINIHVIFNPKILDEFKELFLANIQMVTDFGSRFSLTRQSLTRFGNTCDSSLEGEEAYKEGIEQFTITHNDLVNVLEQNQILKDNCLIFVTNGSNDGVDSSKAHEELLSQQNASVAEVRNSIYRISHGLFSSKPSDLKYFQGKGADTPEEIASKYGSLKPLIHGSDAHTENDLFEPSENKYCWIKAEPTFEGLKQIVHEVDRVKIAAIRPEPKNSYEVIDKIVIADENVLNEEIYLNPNLNTIIGGRSSGKSTLIQSMAFKLNPNSLKEGEVDKHITSLSNNIKIIWQDGKEDYLRHVEYFYQGHMYNKSHDKGIESIVDEIQRNIYPENFTTYKDKTDNLLQANSINISKYLSIKDSEIQVIHKINSIGKLEDIQVEIDKINLEINALDLNDSDSEQMQLHEQSKSEIESMKTKKIHTNYYLTKFQNLTSSDFININNPFATYVIPEHLKDDIDINNFISSIKDEFEAKINEYILSKQTVLNQLVLSIDNDINQKQSSNDYMEREKLFQANQKFKPLQERKNIETNKLLMIEGLETQLKKLQEEYEKDHKDIQQNLFLMENVLDELISTLNTYGNDKIEIQNKSVFQVDDFNKFIIKNLDQRSERAQEIANLKFENTDELLIIFTEILEGVNSGKFKLKTGVSIGNLLNEFYLNTWFKIGYDVIYDGDNYNEMSQGKKAFVVLKLTLDCSNKKCPIIIDQPEDDLDNRAIFTELVLYLKEKKSERQIILVTHNANVVINADSEQIIVANQHGTHSPNKNDKKFAYKTGSIESLKKSASSNFVLDCKSIREHACEILEGGDRAFELREKKYNS